MNKKHFSVLVITILVLLGIVWIWRYTTLNAYYDSFGNIEKKTYYAGDIVPFEKDRIGGYNQADGYFIRVDSFKIGEYDSYAKSSGISLEQQYAIPEKIALVYVTLFNQSSDADGVMLTDLQLHGIDNYVGMNWDLLYSANPILEGNPGIRLPHNTEIQLVLPYDLFRSYFGGYTWEHLDCYDWYLRVTFWPTKKDIRIQDSP